MPVPFEIIPLPAFATPGLLALLGLGLPGLVDRAITGEPADGPLPRPVPHAVVAALAGLLGLWCALLLDGVLLAGTLVLALGLLAITLADLRSLLVPDVFSLPLLALGLLLGPLATLDQWGAPLPALSAHVLAAAAGYGLIAGLRRLYAGIRGVEGIGLGDAKLLAAAGAWVGPFGLPGVLLWGSLAGLGWVLLRRLSGRSMAATDALPFGPFLAGGFWLVWLYGPPLPAF